MVEQRVLIPSVQVRVPVPQPLIANVIINVFLIKLLSVYLLVQHNISAKQINYTNIFKDTLLEYNIIYDKLDTFKSGAICIPTEINKVFSKYAVGFSHSIYKKTAEKNSPQWL